jgi:hypothetical protein
MWQNYQTALFNISSQGHSEGYFHCSRRTQQEQATRAVSEPAMRFAA